MTRTIPADPRGPLGLRLRPLRIGMRPTISLQLSIISFAYKRRGQYAPVSNLRCTKAYIWNPPRRRNIRNRASGNSGRPSGGRPESRYSALRREGVTTAPARSTQFGRPDPGQVAGADRDAPAAVYRWARAPGRARLDLPIRLETRDPGQVAGAPCPQPLLEPGDPL